jgi:PTH1 family peptidyl-tRNA hydrolase
MALVPSTFMNLSGNTALEAVRAGFPADRTLVLHDDKDLMLGVGRLSVDGGSAGHGGVQNIFDELGTQNVFRLRLGIGPCQRPLREWVLGEWDEHEWGAIEGIGAPFAAFMSALAGAGRLEDMRGIVNATGFWEKTCN